MSNTKEKSLTQRITEGLATIATIGAIAVSPLYLTSCKPDTPAEQVAEKYGQHPTYEKFLPENFKDIRFGMTFQELKQLRPFIDTTGKEGVAYEMINQEGILRMKFVQRTEGKVEYFFNNNKLEGIHFCCFRDGIESNLENLFGEENGELFGWTTGEVTALVSDSSPYDRYDIETGERLQIRKDRIRRYQSLYQDAY